MSTEANKALVQRFWEEVFNHQNLAAIDELCVANFTYHDMTGAHQGAAAVKDYLSVYLAAFPDQHVTIEDMIAEGDRVVTRWTVRGTHQGPFMDIAPTGKQVTVTGIDITRVVNGKALEDWDTFDTLGLLQQLAVIPPL
jgi:steroid delta-isomerase-like uncharacterized protein